VKRAGKRSNDRLTAASLMCQSVLIAAEILPVRSQPLASRAAKLAGSLAGLLILPFACAAAGSGEVDSRPLAAPQAARWLAQAPPAPATRTDPQLQELIQRADALEARGAYAEAEPLRQQILAITEKTQGPQQLDTATSLNNLAGLYRALGRYGEAELLYNRSLAIREKLLGLEHRDTASSLDNLAGLYRAQGRYGEAELLYKRSLAIREKLLGLKHRDTASSLNNLAGLYRAQGRYGEAELLYKRSLAIREKLLGLKHRDTASSLNNLAGLYRA